MDNICLDCLRDAYLRRTLAKLEIDCDCCESPGPCVSMFDVARACDDVIDTHFETTHLADAVVIYDRTPAGQALQGTLSSLNVVGEAVLEALTEAVQTRWFDMDSLEHKYGSDDDPWFRMRSDLHGPVSKAWKGMEDSLLYESRHLNPLALEVLQNVLGDIHADRAANGDPVVVRAGPNTEVEFLYRARDFDTEDGLLKALRHPARRLGTPAPGVGRAGRMNAKGQPTFYGATAVSIAIAEIRPAVGSWVATAKFNVIRILQLLDLRRLRSVTLTFGASLFDPVSKLKAERRDFLRTLCDRLAQPVLPSDQDRNYLITQVVADYLATHPNGHIDGIIYPSVQHAKGQTTTGYNVALFSKSSRVAEADGPENAVAELEIYEDGGPYFSPAIWKNIPSPPLTDAQSRRELIKIVEVPTQVATLEIDIGGIAIHKITGVEIAKESFTVSHQSALSWPVGRR